MYWWLHRLVMKLAHRYDWHYAPVSGPLAPTGAYQRWCQWCGFRESFYKGAPGMKRIIGVGGTAYQNVPKADREGVWSRERACHGGEVICSATDAFQECFVCGSRVRFDLADHRFFGFAATCPNKDGRSCPSPD